MKTRIWIFLAMMAGLAFACRGGNNSAEGSYQGPMPGQAVEEEARMAKESYAQDYDQAGEQPQPAAPEKKVIRTANMRMEVKDYPEALASIKELVADFKGELTGENEQQYGGRLENTLVIRVLPRQFDSLLLAFEQLASHVDFKSINAEDVTRQYIDLETRLASKRAVVERYRELLKQAKNVEEILAVEENLRKVVEEIESIEGQLQYMSRQVDYSTINLTIYEEGSQLSTTRSFWSRIGEGFENGWKLLQSLAVGLVTLWPVVLILALLAAWFLRRRRRG
ncbi:MAG: DUF4349 domain-containing protein [Phaeodactylibacter sp.]|nr:DUF4349 domain-containing protein [Phaeodactylibacter sp.]